MKERHGGSSEPGLCSDWHLILLTRAPLHRFASAAEQHNGTAGTTREQLVAAGAALGELEQDQGLQALEGMLNKATGYLLHHAEGK